MAHITNQPRTSKLDWNELLDRLTGWFNVKHLGHAHSARFYDKVKIFPLAALTYAVDSIIDERRPTAGNWPTITDVIGRCFAYLDRNPDEKFQIMEFDPNNDPDYPIGKLWKALDVLMKLGPKAFESYVQAQRMPKQDIERVISKARYIRAGMNPEKMAADITKRVGIKVNMPADSTHRRLTA